MPAKKQKTTLVTEDMLVEAVTARVTEDLKRDMDERFGRFEQALERIAAPNPPEQPPVPVNTAPTAIKDPTNMTVDPQIMPQQPLDSTVQSSLRNEVGIHLQPHAPAAATPFQQDQHPTRAAIAQPELSAASAQDVNKNIDTSMWRAWRTVQQRPDRPDPPRRPVSYETQALYDPAIDEQVRHVLEATPHHFKGNTPHDFPYNYVTRGPEKRKLSFNTVTLAEHIYGMFCMIDDHRVDPDIKPDIIEHMKEVAEDACEFEWPGYVRRWSEEVFNRVAERRLPKGWGSVTKIQNLRTGMSRVDSARLSFTRDQRDHRDHRDHRDQPVPRRQPSSTHQNDPLRGGPPCHDFNSAQGCSLQSGHSIHGKKQVHVCSYCLVNTAAAHPHSEANCRTKQRHSASHF